jgi:hypothetical protein
MAELTALTDRTGYIEEPRIPPAVYIVAAYQLTEREQDVLRLVCRGLRTVSVAHRCIHATYTCSLACRVVFNDVVGRPPGARKKCPSGASERHAANPSRPRQFTAYPCRSTAETASHSCSRSISSTPSSGPAAPR